MLHADNSCKSLAVDMLKHIQVVDLSGGGFFSPRVFPYLELGDLIPCPVHVGDQIAFLDLHVIEVIQDLA